MWGPARRIRCLAGAPPHLSTTMSTQGLGEQGKGAGDVEKQDISCLESAKPEEAMSTEYLEVDQEAERRCANRISRH